MMEKREKSGSTLIPAAETALFCEQIALMLHSGILLTDGVEALKDAYKTSRYAPRFSALSDRVHETGTLYEAVQESGLFPKYMVQMVRIGERSGSLEDIMTALAAYYHGEEQVRTDLRNAVVYPLLLAGMMLVLLVVLISRVFPLFSRVIGGLPAEVAASSGAAVRFGTGVGVAVLALFALMIAAGLTLYILWRCGRREGITNAALRLLPPVRNTFRLLSASRFASVMGKLLSGGYPIDEALDMAPEVMSDAETKKKLLLCKQRMDAGDSFADAVREAEVFSPLYEKMLFVGQTTGQIDKTLLKLSDILYAQADEKINRLTGLVEPIIIGVFAVILGALLLAVMLPLASALIAL